MMDWTAAWMQKVSTGYTSMKLETAFGRTALLARNHERKDLEPILFIPGFRTCGIFWDINGNLASLYDNYRIYLLDVLGQPGLSYYKAPPVRLVDYGLWLAEIIEDLGLEQVNIAGVSFGGFLIFKLARIDNDLIKRAFICNPVGFQMIRYNWNVLFHNAKPYVVRNRASLHEFLDHVIINAPEVLAGTAREHIVDFLENTIRHDKLKTQFPYKYSDKELQALTASTHLIVDAADTFINQVTTEKRARKVLPNLQGVHHIKGVGHGLEFAVEPIQVMQRIMENA